MDREKLDRLSEFVSNIDASEEARTRFLAQPLPTIGDALGIDVADANLDQNAADRLLAAILRDDASRESLAEIGHELGTGAIQLPTARLRTARVLVGSGSREVSDPMAEAIERAIEDAKQSMMTREEIEETMRQPLPVEPFDPKEFGPSIANVIVGLDIAVAVTEVAIANSEYFFSGRGRNPIGETRRMATILTRDR